MFRTQANPMDDSIVKATDETLTSENWEYMLDVCDRVSASPSIAASQAVASLIKRLAHRNANVQLYALELANALSQNCGPPLHRELASKAFTDALLRLAGDRNTHAQVKQKVLERMGSWSEEFQRHPDLGIMEEAYGRLRRQQPGLMPPSKPTKKDISAEDRRKEDSELQMALALSLQDKGGKSSAGAGENGANARDVDLVDSGSVSAQAAPPSGAPQQGTTAATVSRVRALYDFTPSEQGELAFRKNDIIAVLESVYQDWWKGSLRGQTGIFPLNYVEKLQDPTREELERDAHMESEVFGEIKDVEKLLALLSVRDGAGGAPGRRGEREEEEIAELYQRTLSIRPKLIELIGKYSQKKDDFTQLNEKFIKARRDYEALLENSMSTPHQQYQQQYPIRARQPSYPPRQHSQHQPYGPPAPQQLPPAGYPPQQPFAAQSQQHLPPQQQDPQRFYSPGPSEPPQAQAGYASPYPQQNGPPQVQPASGGPAPFHFIPGGLQGPPPGQQQQQSPQQEQHAIRRKSSPQGPPANGPSDPYGAAAPTPQGFQGQIRPNSIHTLNSGNPQELATGGYESPIENRHSYPPSQQQQQQPQMQPPQQQYDGYVPPQQAYQQQPLQTAMPPQQRSDRDGLPSRQRTQSFESPPSLYSQAPDGSYPQQQAAPPQPSGQSSDSPAMPPAGYGTGAPPPQGGYQAYQPFSPGMQHQVSQVQLRRPSGSSAGGDPGEYYR